MLLEAKVTGLYFLPHHWRMQNLVSWKAGRTRILCHVSDCRVEISCYAGRQNVWAQLNSARQSPQPAPQNPSNIWVSSTHHRNGGYLRKDFVPADWEMSKLLWVGNSDVVEAQTCRTTGVQRGSGSAALARKGCSERVAVVVRPNVMCQRLYSQEGEGKKSVKFCGFMVKERTGMWKKWTHMTN